MSRLGRHLNYARDLGEPPGVRHVIHSTAFSQSKFTERLPHVYPQLAHGRRKESSRDTTEWSRNRLRSPKNFIGTLVPNFIVAMVCAGLTPRTPYLATRRWHF